MLIAAVWTFQATATESLEPDWQLVTALWQNFVEEPSELTARDFCNALPLGRPRIAMPEDENFREDLFDGIPFVIEEIRNGNPWAVHLGLRLADLSVVPHWYELMTALSDLASVHPEVFLQQMAIYHTKRSDPPNDPGVVWFFGSPEVVLGGHQGLSEAATKRAEALSRVNDPGLNQLRDRYINFLRSMAAPRPESTLPQVIRSFSVDPSVFSGIVVEGTVVVAEVIIAKDGSTKTGKLLRGVHPDVDEAFLEALRQWQYEVPLKDGKPVEFTYIQTLRIDVQ